MAIVVAYSFAYLLWYWQTPMGQTPVLDGAENIALADSIFQGTLPAEPFYRALLYPAYLAIFRFLGFSVADLHSVAGISGIFFHLLNTILIGWISFKLWNNSKSFITAVLLYGLYPPAIFFAADPLDITMAIFFLSLTLALTLQGFSTNRAHFFLWAGLVLGVGGLLRANILPLAGAIVLLAHKPEFRKGVLLFLLGLALPMVAGGVVNLAHSGQFRVLPWQGSFNLYSANHSRANGKHFQQTIMLPDRNLSKNPARMESEIQYFRDTGEKPPYAIARLTSHWKKKTLDSIKSNPGVWIKLVMKKVYYLFNNFEQYNNKTFSFHKELSPVLRANPLCFGIILLLFTLTMLNAKIEQQLKFFILSLIFLAGGIVAFYVSARFRILLLPIMVTIASGVFSLEKNNFLNKRNLAIACITGLISFSNFLGATDISTYNSDRLLIAHACARLNLDSEQIKWADEVLKEQPENLLAIRVKLVGFTNLALAGKLSDQHEWAKVGRELDFLRTSKVSFPDTLFLAGCYAFTVKNDKNLAIAYWEAGLEISEQKDLFHAAMILTNVNKPKASLIDGANNSPLLWYSLVKAGMLLADDQKRLQINAQAVKFLLK